MSYVNKEQIERAKRLDLLTYLHMHEPAELVRCSRNVYTTRTHDSLKISNG
ncbi:MAG TPA: topoisomerase, partial [Gammaproteobacteria bacterium]